MTRDELIEKVMYAMGEAWLAGEIDDGTGEARVAVDIVLEEAAKVARLCHQDQPDYPTTSDEWADGNNYACEEIARQLCALKSGDGE